MNKIQVNIAENKSLTYSDFSTFLSQTTCVNNPIFREVLNFQVRQILDIL